MVRNGLVVLLFAAGMAAAASLAYYIGHNRGKSQGKQDAALGTEQLNYYNSSVAQLVTLGYAWDGTKWSQSAASSFAAVPANSSPLPDRSNCAEIAGTSYRSASERSYYLSSCLGQTVTPTTECGTPVNPWCFDLVAGMLISTPPGNFCDYLDCAANFWLGDGYVIRCRDGKFSKSGGDSDACAANGGVWQPLYSH